MSVHDKRHGIVTAGTWCADHNKLVETWPREEGLVKILSDEVRGGGSACNLAIDIKRLDPALSVSTIGLLGDDGDGALLMQQASTEGLETSRLAVAAGHRTTFTDAFTAQDTTRRTHLFHAGVGAELSPDHFDFSTSTARILHLGLPGIHERMDSPWENDANGWVTVLKNAQSLGLKTNLELCSLTPEALQSLVQPCLPHLNYLIVNNYEIAAVAGKPVTIGKSVGVDACVQHASSILETPGLELVIVHFPQGAIAVSKAGEQVLHASVNMPGSDIVGTNGAGDAFAAGALYGLHEGWSLDATLQLAHAAAATSMRHIGTTDALMEWKKCLALADGYGWRAELA
ncbi:MAG: carbohydrate kinase family protein [Pseudomonadota bacterium]